MYTYIVTYNENMIRVEKVTINVYIYSYNDKDSINIRTYSYYKCDILQLLITNK